MGECVWLITRKLVVGRFALSLRGGHEFKHRSVNRVERWVAQTGYLLGRVLPGTYPEGF